MLYGTEKSVLEKFQLDKEEWKFSKEKAVTLTIQLIDQRYFKICHTCKDHSVYQIKLFQSVLITQLQRHRRSLQRRRSFGSLRRNA